MPRHRRNRNRPQTERKDSRASYKDIVKENATFEHYYKEQKCFDLNEFDKFLDAMKTPLPAVFRITGYKKHSKQLLTNMKQNYFEAMTDLRIDDDPIKPPQVLPWYPDELAWQTNLNRSQIRRVPQLEKFHAFLIAETESGHITRQEAVSMIPPLLLDVQPHHKVLDMCAAPGSKTAQIVELLHKDEAKPIPEGLCVANDKDNKRCYMLVHQIHRLNSPSTVIVNHDAATFPDLYLNTTNGKQKLEYDRVLCDVPCSGDGTMRKNTDVWLKWNVANSIYLHGTQLRILMRGLELLAEGGQLVYSTCSLNPLEDEAVVAAALSRAAGSVELAPIQLPGLKWSPGVSDWKVMDKHKAWYDNYSQLPESARNIARSMFPPDDADRLNLDRCMRLLPHHQDTGGFFVAVLRKTRTLPWQQVKPQQPSQQVTEERSPKAEVPKKRPRWGPGFKEDPFVFVTPGDMKTLEQIKSFFGFDENFPTNQLLSRTTSDKKKHLYFVSDITKNLVEKNESRLKVINTGVRAFSRCDNTHQNLKSYFRIVQNASECLLQFMSARVVKTHLSDVIKLLIEEQPIYDHFSDDLKESLTQLGDAGSMIFRYEPEDGSAKVRCELLLCGWKGNRAARLYMNKHERVHFLNLCDHVIPAYLLPNKNSRRSREAAAADDVKDVEAAAAGDVVSNDDVMANDRVAVNDDVTVVDDDVVVAAGNGNVAVDADDVITGGDVNGDVTSVD